MMEVLEIFFKKFVIFKIDHLYLLFYIFLLQVFFFLKRMYTVTPFL